MAIRKVDTKAVFKIISQYDDAIINETAEEAEALKASGGDTRYSLYLDNLDESKLVLDPSKKPTYFHIRCLKNTELAEINAKHLEIDVVAKTSKPKNASLMMLELFDVGCIGMEDENGKVQKVTSDEVGFGVALGIGTSISIFTSLGKQLKND